MKVYAIIIVYNPNLAILKQNLMKLSQQVDEIVICDNTEKENIKLNEKSLKLITDKIKLFTFNSNLGIAEATNVGLLYSFRNGADWALTSDQDTIFPDDYLEKFKIQVATLSISPNNIAAIVPLYFDRNTKVNAGFTYFNGKNTYQAMPKESNSIVFEAIASGMFINLLNLNKIGVMDSKLFIDWVDLEWCWRANAKGFKIIGCKQLLISHCLGDINKKIGRKKITLRNPIRHYYILRNCIYLSKTSPFIPKKFKMQLKIKAFRYFFGYTYLAKPHCKNFLYLCKAVIDGLLGKMGKLKNL